ncbi:MAG: hypothetical protein FJ302_15995 [Planctomycetes bacterium]|nr:hypothetical protein [Planctomycetota bacterium]
MRRLSLLFTLLAAVSSSTLLAQEKPKEETPKEAPKATQAELDAIAAVKKAGGSVLQVAQNDNRLDIAFHLADGKIGDEQVATVKPLGNIIYSLNLRGTEVTDKGLEQLKELKSLVRLHLERTKITDAGAAHLTALENLEYLNLYGTEVTDAGVQSLAGSKKLKRLYVWQTKVTEEGQAKFKAANTTAQLIPDIALDKKRAEIEAQRKAEAEAKAKEEEAKKKAEEEKKKKEEEEKKKKEEEEKKKKEEEAKKKAEEDKKKADEKKDDKKPEEKKEEKK